MTRTKHLTSPWRSRLLTAGVCAIGPAVGVAFQALDPDMRNADVSFYATVATVSPLVGLALFVEIVLVMASALEAESEVEVRRALARCLIRTNAALLILSEAPALYAVADQASNGFLAACATVPPLLQVLLLIDTAYHRMGLSRLRSSISPDAR